MGSSTATIPFPRSRLGTIPVASLGSRHHTAVALLEVDITKARRRILPESAGTNDFLGWLVSQIAVSIRNHPEVHSGGRRQAPGSEAVHVRVMVERALGERRVDTPVLVPHADSCAPGEITCQLDAARREPLDEASVVFAPVSSTLRRLLERPFRALPSRIRTRLVTRAFEKGRHLRAPVALAGRTVTVTSLGSGVRVRGWYIPRVSDPVAIGVGAVTQKAAVVNGRIEPREIVHLSVLLEARADDDASRWLSSLIKGMEGAFTAEKVV